MDDFSFPDAEFQELRQFFEELKQEHERLRGQKPVNLEDHYRHAKRLRSLRAALDEWRLAHLNG